MTQTTFLLGAALTALLCLPIALSVLTADRFDILTPPFFFSVFMFFCYVYPLDSFVHGTDEFSMTWDTSPLARPTESAIETALGIAILAALSFYLGYYSFRPGTRWQPRSSTSVDVSTAADPSRLLFIGAVYTTFGLLLFAVGVYLIGGFGVLMVSLGDRIRTFSGLNYFMGAINLLLCVSLVWFCDLLVTRRRATWSFWFFSAFAVAVNGLQGSKSILFVFVVAMTTMYHVLYRRIGLAKVATGAAVLLVALTSYALVAREYLAVGAFETVDPQNLRQEDVSKALERELGGNFIQLQVLTTLIERMPDELPYQHGVTYLSLFTMPVPRGLWPDKPLPSTGVLALAFWPSRWLDGGTTMPPGLVGEMYLNFAGVGVAVGMFLFGRLYAFAAALLRQRPKNVLVVTSYALTLALMPHYLRGESVAPTVLLLMWGVPTLVAERFVFRQRIFASLASA